MAAKPVRLRATLQDLPDDFSLAFLKGSTISQKSKKQGYRYYAEHYYHNVSMFLDEEKTIYCSAKCYASYRTNDEPRSVYLDITPTDISLAHCSCQAGSGETCSHLVGFITALQQWQLMGLTEVPAELPCTSLPQKWSVPRRTKIQPEAVPHMTFVNPKPVRKKRPIKNVLTNNRRITVQTEDLQYLKQLDSCPLSYLVANPTKVIDTHLRPVPVESGLSTHAVFFEPQETVVAGTNCGNLVFPQSPIVEIQGGFDIDIVMSEQQCVQIEETTRDQANCVAWFEARKNKLTASNFGLIIGATPDGKACEDGTTGIVEVKCPYSVRDMTIHEACSVPGFFMTYQNDTYDLKTEHNYYYQVQGQLLVTGVEYCDFVVSTRKDLVV